MWWSPNISLMQKTINSKEFGGAMSAYQFITTMVGCTGTIVLGSLIQMLGGGPEMIGKIIAGTILLGHSVAICAW